MTVKNFKINISGMMCEGCECRIENTLSKFNKIENIKANYKDGTVSFDINNELLNSNDILGAVVEKIKMLGFDVLK